MNKIISYIAIVISMVAVAVALVGNQPETTTSVGSGTRFANGLSADSTSPSAGEVRGTTLTITSSADISGASTFGSDMTITTANTATSSINVGCIETYATSTETVMRLSATTTPPYNAMWVYGACSGL